MVKAATIKTFFQSSPIAFIGVSLRKDHFSRTAYETLKKNGYKLIAVNPKYTKYLEDECYPDLKSIPFKVESALILTSPKYTETVVKEALDYGIKNLWLQQGSQTAKAIEMAQQHQVNLVYKQCIFMFAEPVTSIHKFHRSIKKLFGRLPK